MWTGQCALLRRPSCLWPRENAKQFNASREVFFCLIICLLLSSPFTVYANETIIAAVTLNQQSKGDFFILLGDDGGLLVQTVDLEAMGFSQVPGTMVEIEGTPYINLKSIEGVTYHLDENTLTLEITAAPDYLTKTSLDLSPSRRLGVIYPRDSSVFLNYGVDYSVGGDDFGFEGLTLSNELGVRHRDLLLLADTLYTESPDNSQFVRLNTSLTWDDRETLRRVIGGDFFASSGELGSRVQMGGVSFSKIYRIDPYYIRYPLFDFTGLTSLPSDVELYVDGVRVRSERFGPGEFELRNFKGVSGAQTIEVVVRDALGREQRVVSPFYFTDQLLRQGLHEYSYNLGLLRRDFGLESNNYSDLAFSAFHRYGLTDNLNIGLRTEAGDGLANLGFESAVKVGSLGLVRAEGAGSFDTEGRGAAGFFSYEYFSRRFRGRLALQGFSEGYRSLGDRETTIERKLNLLAGIGYVTEQVGSFGADLSRSESYTGPAREILNLSWSRRLWKGTYVNANFRRIREGGTSYEGGVNLTCYLGGDRSLSAAARREGDADIQTLEARQNTPSGEGTGWDVRGERSEQDGGVGYQINTVAQHNARNAILRGELDFGQSETTNSEDLRLSVAGALVHVGDTFAPTRPVTDSFALVSVGEAEGVGVYVNGQISGHTDRRGKVIVPSLSSYYENQVSIEDKDIPLDYLMPQVRLNLSPPLRSGTCINFPLQKYRAFTGTLMVEGVDGKEPLANAELTLGTPNGDLTFWTGGEGEFYLDSQQADFNLEAHQGCDALKEKSGPFLPQGVYPLTFHQKDRTFSSEIIIPEVSEQYAELGEIVLPAVPIDTLEGDSSANPKEEEGSTSPADRPISPEDASLPAKLPNSAMGEELGSSPRPGVTADSEKSPSWPAETVIYFPFDRSSPDSGSLAVLAGVTTYLQTHPEITVTIEGHTCRLGNETYNDQLGRRRAEAVRDFLVKEGVAPERILRVCSYGERRPVCSEAAEDCYRRNRRVVVRLEKRTNPDTLVESFDS